MITFKKDPIVKFSNQVHTTTDYFLFKPIDGNRNKSPLHLKRLKRSMSKNYLFTIIIVNEKYEIIDGQHRFDIIKELGLPLNYVICRGYGLNEVHILNANSKTWNADDYLDGYCQLKYPEYVKYAEFKSKYGFGHNECLAILNNSSSFNSDLKNIFYTGNYKVKNYERACDIAEKIKIIGNYYQGYKRRSFVFAFMKLSDNKNFIFSEFVQKLKAQPTSLVDCVDASQYLSLIEHIYNYRRKEKVNLRY